MMMSKLDLNTIRQQIDVVDEQIQDLLTQRAQLAQDVAKAKQASSENVVFYRPEREAEVLRKVMARNQGPLSDDHVAILFREIMSACLNLQNPMKIAYLGPAGTFTEAAAFKHFGQAVNTLAMPCISDVFHSVETGNANYGVVPIENSTAGIVHHTLDMFIQSPLKICGEVELTIHHNLMSQHAELSDIKTLYSHSQSFAQCNQWLNAHLPGVHRVPLNSNAEAAQKAATEQHSAAIASEMASKLYQLNLLSQHIEDEANNTTRFLIIGNQAVPVSSKDKTSLMMAVHNQSGALHQLLTPFAENNISMTRIESRPSQRGMWDYVFFIDIEGHIENETIQKTLEILSQQAATFKILGSYPCAVL